MKELIERLEKATGPDRKLGNEVLLACGWTIREYGLGSSRSTEWVNPDPSGTDYSDLDQPNPTASIDAALTLTDGRPWTLRTLARGCEARVGGKLPEEFMIKGGEHEHAAIALCIAALKARDALTP